MVDRVIAIAPDDLEPAGAAHAAPQPVVDMALELAKLRADLRETREDLAVARDEAEAARGNAFREAAQVAEREKKEMVERSPWGEGARHAAGRISVVLEAMAAQARRAARTGAPDARR